MNSSLDLLKIKNALITEQINFVAFYSDKMFQILSVVLSNNDIVIWKVTSENTNQILKWIPWRKDEGSRIQAITFQSPSVDTVVNKRIELLVVTRNNSIYIIFVDKILDGRTVHHSYSQFFLYPSCPLTNFTASAITWWESPHVCHKNIAIIGGNNGQIVFYSLTNSHFVACMNTGSKSAIFSLSICSDFFRDFCYLLITDDLRQQWKLLLEKELNDKNVTLIAFEKYEPLSCEKKDNELVLRSQKSRLQELKQMSVDTFTLLKQKLNDSRKTTHEKSKFGNSLAEVSELQSCECYGDAFLSVQQFRNRNILAGLFVHESVLEMYMQNKDTITLINHKFRTSSLVTNILFTHTFIYVADISENQHNLLVFSTRLSEFKKSEIVEYNPAAFIQSFMFPGDEQIIGLFKIEIKLPYDKKYDILNLSATAEPASSNNPPMHSRIKQIRLEDEWNEACLVVTNKSVYIISLKNNPLKLAFEYMKTDVSLLKSLPFIFNVPLSKLIELITDRLIEERHVNEALVLCNRFKCFSGKITLRLASFGYMEELLLYTEKLLNQVDIVLPAVERIHLSNFVVTCYAERYLRNTSNAIIKRKFMRFLKNNHYYDEEVNIHILAVYRLCEFVNLLIESRGLNIDGMIALTNMIIQGLNDELKNLMYFDGFWHLFSVISLVDAFVLSPRSLHLHIDFMREFIHEIPQPILKKLYQFYDPVQPVLKPALSRLLNIPIEQYFELYDYDNDKWGSDANMFDWITNFIYVHIHLYKDNVHYDQSLTEYVTNSITVLSASSQHKEKWSDNLTSLSAPVLSAGFAHAALIRNGSLVMWGQSRHGCLGCGPTLSENCAPTLNLWFEDHRIRVKYVTCGKSHTLALTENGLYAWGCSRFGQLGTGSVTQAVYPRLLETLSFVIIASVSAGQYHSLAVDVDGRLWTWGWGVYGQLGHGDVDDQHFPKCVESLRKKIVLQVAGGQAHSVVLTKGGKVYTFGCNTFGQLGIGTTAKCTVPVKVFGIQENIVMVATNYFHNLAVSEFNRLYTWGCSPQVLKLQSQSQRRSKSMPSFVDKATEITTPENKLNNELEAINLHIIEKDVASEMSPIQTYNKHLCPTLVDTSAVNESIKQVSCGLFHSALLTTNSQIYTWGRNMDCQLGNCRRHSDILAPTLVTLFPVKLMSSKQQMEIMSRSLWSVSCGKDYTIVVELESRLYGWGNNSYGQLGTLPQEDFSIKRFLDSKFIVNKSTKRMIKLSHSSTNITEKPTEIINLPKFPFLLNPEAYTPDRYIQLERNLNLPGLRLSRYPIYDTRTISPRVKGCNQVLHYYLECFHQYYDVNYILQVCSEIRNIQAISKVCFLNYRFFDAFFYGLKALLSYVQENYYFNSFKETCYEDLSKKRLIPKNVKRDVQNSDSSKEFINFEFVEDVVSEAVSMFEKNYKLVVQFTPDKLSSFLKQSISVWILWEIPILRLENLLSLYLEDVGYPLAVILFCDQYKVNACSRNSRMNVFSYVENSGWREKQLSLPAYLHQKNHLLSLKMTKYPFINSDGTKVNYRNLYRNKNGWSLQSTNPKYQLTADEILQQLSVQFTLKLCDMMVKFLSTKSTNDFEEFVRLLHEIIFSPSILKSDDRSSHEILSSVLNTLRSQTSRKKFIQISYEELTNKCIENKLVVFSCSHYYTSRLDFEKEINSVATELQRLHLVGCSELVTRLFNDTPFTCCCPSCLFRFIEKEVTNSKTKLA